MGKGKKVALLVGVGTYGNGLKPLQCPANGVKALQAVLETPEIGGFDEVTTLLDPDVGTMRTCLGEVFGRLNKDDLVLFYFIGHGIKDMHGAFYLTTAQTRLFDNGCLNPGTAVEASFVKGLLGSCYAQRKVVVLDCCFGAAFADGFLTMDDGSVDVQADLGGEGYVVLTAATARNYALEQAGEPLSVYTRYLVEGLKTGAAAPEGEAHVSVSHLHSYVRRKVQMAAPTMNPTIFNGLAGQEIWLTRAAVNPELTYRQKVLSKVRRGRIAPAGKRFLEAWQQRLSIGPERAAAIEAEVLQPFAEQQRHLDLYGETLQEEIEEEFPFSAETLKDLKDLQNLWNLRDADVELLTKKFLREQGINAAGALTTISRQKPMTRWATPVAMPEPEISKPTKDFNIEIKDASFTLKGDKSEARLDIFSTLSIPNFQAIGDDLTIDLDVKESIKQHLLKAARSFLSNVEPERFYTRFSAPDARLGERLSVEEELAHKIELALKRRFKVQSSNTSIQTLDTEIKLCYDRLVRQMGEFNLELSSSKGGKPIHLDGDFQVNGVDQSSWHTFQESKPTIESIQSYIQKSIYAKLSSLPSEVLSCNNVERKDQLENLIKQATKEGVVKQLGLLIEVSKVSQRLTELEHLKLTV